MNVMIGVDPHKGSHTAVAIDGSEAELAKVRVRASRRQLDDLLTWATPFDTRTWAVESAGGLGFLLSEQLIAAGEHVVDVPATLAARVRVLGTGCSNKNDPNDARSVAIAALRAPQLGAVNRDEVVGVLRLLAKRNHDLGRARNRTACRLHALLAELVPGGIPNEINASSAQHLLDAVQPTGPVEVTRHAMAVEHLEDLRRLDTQMRDAKKRIADAVAAAGTSLTELFGVGPVVACMLVGYTGDVRRFRTRNHYATYNGTAPIELSSGGRIVHRLSRRGNRQLNHAIHIAAITQIRTRTPTAGRSSTARSPTATRRKKRCAPSNGGSATPSTGNSSPTPPTRSGPGRATRDDSHIQRDRLDTLMAGASDQPLPNPPPRYDSRANPTNRGHPHAPRCRSKRSLTTKRYSFGRDHPASSGDVLCRRSGASCNGTSRTRSRWAFGALEDARLRARELGHRATGFGIRAGERRVSDAP